ncbi:hypothetical protein [Sorangium sp. So ce1335]|uniref:hypothetical protein n=1 Tax=Sorangium sp. So ce1335 TaxID=3133335 RepID=UPI003F61C7BE
MAGDFFGDLGLDMSRSSGGGDGIGAYRPGTTGRTQPNRARSQARPTGAGDDPVESVTKRFVAALALITASDAAREAPGGERPAPADAAAPRRSSILRPMRSPDAAGSDAAGPGAPQAPAPQAPAPQAPAPQAPLSPAELFHRVFELLAAMEEAQRAKVVDLARRLVPHLTAEDIRNPHDFPDLDDPDWHFEDGQLAGIEAVRFALRGLARDVLGDGEEREARARPEIGGQPREGGGAQGE